MRIRLKATLALLLCGLAAAPGTAAAQSYPDHPVRMIVPFAPGGGSDIAARLAAQCMAQHLGQTVVVENRAGAGGTIGTEAAAKAPPDGYTIALLTTSSAVLNVFLYQHLSFDIRHDLVAVAEVGRSPSVLTVRPGLATTFEELRAAAAKAKAEGRDLTFGSGGNGTGPHLAGTMLAKILGVEMTHVPFRGSGPALTAVLSGQVDMLIEAVPVQYGQIQDGGVKALLIAGPKRDPLLPQVPAASELGIQDFAIENSYGLFAPAQTPPAILETLAASLRKGLAEPNCVKRLADLGIAGGAQDPASFGAYWRSELRRWEPIVAASGANVE